MTSPRALYSIAEIRSIEQAALAGLPAGALMQRAGQAAARAAWELLPEPRSRARVLVLAGPGNNGGDALEAALCLRQNGAHPEVVFFGDAGHLPADALQALRRAEAAGLPFIPLTELGATLAREWTLAIDGLYGIGLKRPIDSPQREWVQALDKLACPLLALDVPSGLDAGTGAMLQGGVAVRADHTITFLADKPGLHTGAGRDHAGAVQVARLGVEDAAFPAAQAWLNHPALFASRFKPRRHDSHKGSYGDVAVIGGAAGMGGAVILAARAAAYCGAGRVYACFLDQAPAYDSMQPELMCRAAAATDFAGMTLAVGPGLGTSREAQDQVARALTAAQPLVLDADGLNLLALETGLQHKLQHRRAPTILTPHPLEAGRLLGASAAQVQADRVAAARELAQRFGAIVVLKGSGTVIAGPDGRIAINPTGNPALATAGSGDVLTGVCVALLAQGIPAREAALAAVWLHGQAADELVEQGIGPAGLTAVELIPALRSGLNRLCASLPAARPRS